MFSDKVLQIAMGLVIVEQYKVLKMDEEEIILLNDEVTVKFEPRKSKYQIQGESKESECFEKLNNPINKEDGKEEVHD